MHIHIGWPQGIMLAWFLLVLALNVRFHGKPKTGLHNGWAGFTVQCLIYAVLFWGGFFG